MVFANDIGGGVNHVMLTRSTDGGKRWSTPVDVTQTNAPVPELRRVYLQASLSNVDDRDAPLSHPEFLVFTGSGVADGKTRVALVAGRLVGFASIAAEVPDRLELEDLFVDPNWQRRGIARLLVADLVQTARSGGVGTLFVSGNPHAKAFYLSVGFVEFGTVVTELGSAPRLRTDLTSSHSSTDP